MEVVNEENWAARTPTKINTKYGTEQKRTTTKREGQREGGGEIDRIKENREINVLSSTLSVGA